MIKHLFKNQYDLKQAEEEFNRVRQNVNSLEEKKYMLQEQAKKINEKHQELQSIIASGDLISNFVSFIINNKSFS